MENKEQEIDLVVLLKLIKQGFISFLSKTVLLIGVFYIFLRKKIIHISIVGILSVVLGGVYVKFIPKDYVNKIVILTNPDFSQVLYNRIEYYNSIIQNRNSLDELYKLGFNSEELKNVKGFDVKPLKNDHENLDLYTKYLANFRSKDSTKNILSFKEYTNTLLDISYPKQEIMVYSKTNQSYLNNIYKIISQETVSKIVQDKNNSQIENLSERKIAIQNHIDLIEQEKTIIQEIIFSSDRTKSQEMSLVYYLQMLNKLNELKQKVISIDKEIQTLEHKFSVLDELPMGIKQRPNIIVIIFIASEVMLLLFLLIVELDKFFHKKYNERIS